MLRLAKGFGCWIFIYYFCRWIFILDISTIFIPHKLEKFTCKISPAGPGAVAVGFTNSSIAGRSGDGDSSNGSIGGAGLQLFHSSRSCGREPGHRPSGF